MSTAPKDSEFHYLKMEAAELTAEEFLKQELAHLREHFSYEELSGLSPEELERQRELCDILTRRIYANFTNPDSVWANRAVAEFITDGEYDLYEPLSDEQRLQIVSVRNELNRNFDKAYEDAQDRKYDRISQLASSIPLIRRIRK